MNTSMVVIRRLVATALLFFGYYVILKFGVRAIGLLGQSCESTFATSLCSFVRLALLSLFVYFTGFS